MITFGRKQVKHKSNKVTPQDLDAAAANINECGLPSYTSPTHEKINQNIYANSKMVKESLNEKSTTIDAFNGSDRLQEQLKTNILHGGNKRLEWPRGSIPRTVKKLSWDDEHINTGEDVRNNVINPDVSLTPMENVNLRGDPVNLDTIVA